MKKNILIFIILITALFVSNAGALENTPSISDGVHLESRNSEDETPRYNLRVFIKVHKVLYQQDEPVLIRFLIKNQEPRPIELKIADKFFFELFFCC